MTIFQIEVRARSEQHDTQAHRLAREIIHLPLKQLPSLNTIVAFQKHPLSIRTAQLYLLSGKLFPANVDQLITNLLVDPVVQEAQISNDAVVHHHVIDVFFHSGVTDPLAESVLTGAQILGLTGLEQVETGQRYILDRRLSETGVRAIAEALLYNPVIQHYTLRSKYVGASRSAPRSAQFIAPKSDTPQQTAMPVAQFIAPEKGLMSASEARLTSLLNLFQIDLIVLAGWMRILSAPFLAHFPRRVINLHPALLPDDGTGSTYTTRDGTEILVFRGLHAVRQALDAGIRVTGSTVHYVTPEVDAGPVICQEEVAVEPWDTEESLHERVKAVEHRLIVEAIKKLHMKRFCQ